MPRPMRLDRPRYARRRHRSWIRSMMVASVGWGVWWVFFFVLRLDHGAIVALPWVQGVTCALGVLGLGVALFSLRAARAWVLFVLFPLLANASLFFVPWLVEEWMASLN